MPRTGPVAALSGSFRLFKVFGISVYMHWSWLLVAFFEIQYRVNLYSSQAWNVAEYVALFGIVLLHEFGHALACRSVGGQANQIVLWPLGGIAFVNPPAGPGALLWSIAAGPLVNVALVPLTIGAYVVTGLPGARGMVSPDLDHFLLALTFMNLSLLIFNILPIYPLDGGQILQALLWFVIGRVKSLLTVSVIGMVAGAAALVWAVSTGNFWIAIIALFAASRSLAGFQQARAMAKRLDSPRRDEASCPACQTAPPIGDFWACDNCRAVFDTFAHGGVCPGCGKHFAETSCPACAQTHTMASWYPADEPITPAKSVPVTLDAEDRI